MFSSPVDLLRVSSEITFTDFAFSGFLIFIPNGFVPCLLKENFYGLYPQWFCIFNPSGFVPCLLRKKFHRFCLNGPLYFHPQWICFVSPQRELSQILPLVVFLSFPTPTVFLSWASIYKWFRLLSFDLWCFRATKSKEGYCRHPNLYRSIIMVLGLNDDCSRSLLWQKCVENHLESSRKLIKILSLNLRGVRFISSGARL